MKQRNVSVCGLLYVHVLGENSSIERDTVDLLVASVGGDEQVNAEKCQWGEFVVRLNVNN